MGGFRGARPLTPRELAALIEGLEAEDATAAFAAGGGGGALPRSCACPLPDISRAQLATLLAPLPRAPDGRVPFAALQRVVLAARAARVADLQRLFPAPPSAAGAARRLLPAAGPSEGYVPAFQLELDCA